jgi:MoaA/NifB/PqqE/SkfB family radical SAM enzyme
MSFEPALRKDERCRDEEWRQAENYVSTTMEFRCNLACSHCMIEGTMDWLKPQTASEFEALLARNAAEGCWKGLILTGSEITLNRGLPQMAERARRSGFSHVRIQTHGMHLSNADFCSRLVDAGIDEFFVSVTAGDSESHDAITQVKGSFDRILRGLENLERHDVVVITNTVVTEASYRSLPALVARLGHLKKLRQMEFWNYFPMREDDHKNLVVRFDALLPVLIEAIDLARALGRRVEVKNVPECLLGDHADALINDQPELMIDPRFWDEFGRNGFYQCVHRDSCASRKCLGLNTAYVKKFGWEADRVSPLPVSEERAPERI